MVPEVQLCTFFADGLLFGVDVQKVQEVVACDELTRVPMAPPVVCGLINLRGRIVTVLDLRRRLGLPPASAGPSVHVIVRGDHCLASLRADAIGEVHTLTAEHHESPPESLAGPARELIEAIYKTDRQLVHQLNLDAVLNWQPQGQAFGA